MLGFTGNRQWVYAKHIAGTFQRVHRVSGLLLQAFLVLTPWIHFRGMPLVRLDLPARRLYLLGEVFTASEGFTIALMGITAAFGLFFFTALFGRLWCGYLCPQTVFLEEWVRPIEHLLEGDRAQRLRRDAGPWNFDRLWRRGVKFSLFAGLALFVGMAVMQWFAGAPQIWVGDAGPVDYGMVGIIGAGLFLDWAWFREQLCSYLCPYARFQSALVDQDSLIIRYDRARGEPRGKGKEAATAGHCIDCNKCVDVCPAGIDIRNGFQLECISCARCIDACETVMPKLGHPSLVQYGAMAQDEGKPVHIVRKRTVVYAVLLTALVSGITWRVFHHEHIELQVNRAPGSLFATDPDGGIRNTFLVHVTNRDAAASHHYAVAIHGLPGARTVMPPLELGPLESRTVPLVVVAPADTVRRTAEFQVEVLSEVGSATVDASFKAPPKGHVEHEEKREEHHEDKEH
jgi:cytochrome c oxidase accessory protein FixG